MNATPVPGSPKPQLSTSYVIENHLGSPGDWGCIQCMAVSERLPGQTLHGMRKDNALLALKSALVLCSEGRTHILCHTFFCSQGARQSLVSLGFCLTAVHLQILSLVFQSKKRKQKPFLYGTLQYSMALGNVELM